ncbi:MAG: hypothetical protein IJU45_03135 [Clostridia bacterium]|nr:hypothetical protein [Clostridia bacterium]
MFHVILGVMTGIGIAVFSVVYAIIHITCMVVPGLVIRFLVKKRPLTLAQRKKFRKIFAAIYLANVAVIGVMIVLTEQAEALFSLISCAGPLAIDLTVNSLILKIGEKKEEE